MTQKGVLDETPGDPGCLSRRLARPCGEGGPDAVVLMWCHRVGVGHLASTGEDRRKMPSRCGSHLDGGTSLTSVTVQPPSVVHFRVAITKFPKPGSFKQQKCILSLFWRPEVRKQGVGRALLPSKLLGRILPRLFQLLVSPEPTHVAAWPPETV